MTDLPRLRKGQEITIDVDDLDAEGEGVAHVEGRTLIVPLAIPGDRVRARVLRPGRDPVPTAVLERESPSPARVPAECPHYEKCGGCAWQDVEYARQVGFKEQVVRANLGALPADRIRPILAAPSPWFYRNKMEYTFGVRISDFGFRTSPDTEHPSTAPAGCSQPLVDGHPPPQTTPADADRVGDCGQIRNPKPETRNPLALGLHHRGRYWDVQDVTDCRLQSPVANDIRNAVREFAVAQAWEPYHKRSHLGEARHLVIREGKRTGEVLLNIVSRSDALPGVETLARDLAQRFPAVASIYWTISPEKGDAIKAHRETLLHGEPRIREVLDGIEFLIGPGTFFQTNTEQAERLCALVAEFREAAGHGPAPVVLDLYCGVGTFALSTARRCPGARVFGVELVEESVLSARENAARNGLEGAEFLAGDVGKRLPEALSAAGRPDVVIVDPPRAGLAPDVARDLVALDPRQILYVSCNPAALGRDLGALTAAGYQVAVAQPVDLFPHTRHVETVVSLCR